MTTALVGFLLLTGLAAASGDLLLLVALPVALAAGVLALVLFANPTANLLLAIAGFVLVASNEEGFQVLEVIYAAYLYAVLAHWYVLAWIQRREQLIHTGGDWAVAVFLGLLPFTLILTAVFGGDFRVAASELISLSMLLVYFPVKQTVANHRDGPRRVLVTVVAMSVLVAIINVISYAGDLSNATALWHIASSRVVVNDFLVMAGALMSLTLLLHSRRLSFAFLCAIAFGLTFTGLIATLARGSWMAFALGSLVLVVLVRARERVRLIASGAVVSAVILGVGFVILGPFMTVILEGISERFGSIATALTRDASMVNRFRETETVLQYVTRNPLIGYGPGVGYFFFDIVHGSTDTDSFVHNGYVGLWYKYGLWGLGLVLYFWYSAVRSGIRTVRAASADYWTRMAGLAGALPLVAAALSTLTQNPFFLKNYLFIIGIAAGLAAGAWQRLAASEAASSPSNAGARA